ncbi:MAG: InlB B-repeat-containing protein [Prevotella sp.]|nr:InlB B-repeat-containing protein [Prevotella sp.]
MKRNIFSAMCMAAVVLLSASCSQNNETIVPATNERATFTGIAESIGGGTRAYNEYSYIVKWNENDQIYVTDNDGHDNTFTLASGKDTPVGTFSEDEMEGGTYAAFISGKTVEAFYPASLKTADGYVWPATQSNNQVAPMYAKQSITGTANEVVNFSSLGAMLQIVFNSTTPDITVTSVTLEHNKKPLSGKFTVNDDGEAVIDKDAKNVGITLDLGTGVEMGNSAKYFYLAIPAGTYSTPEKDEEMTITFTDAVHHKECVMTSTTFPTVKRNTVGRITLAEDFIGQKRTVKFNMKGRGDAIQDVTVAYGNTVTAPSTPKAANSVFWCWCTDEDCTTPYDFSKAVTADMTLYAKWTDGINGHAYVTLAGKKWATENVGACYVHAHAGPDNHANYWGFYYYIHNPYYHEDYALDAAQSWGSESNHKWTLPSESQWQALINSCYWEWTGSYKYLNSPYNGKPGYIVYQAKSDADKGQKNKSNSGYTPATDTHIFLPAAGWSPVSTTSVTEQGAFGYYWSTGEKKYLEFSSSYIYIFETGGLNAMAVRPISE